MPNPMLHEAASLHDALAEHYLAEPDKAKAAEFQSHCDRCEAEEKMELARTPRSRRNRRAVAARVEGSRWRMLTKVAAADSDPVNHVKHAIVAAQLHAVAADQDPTEAVRNILQVLARSKNEAVVTAAKSHPIAHQLAAFPRAQLKANPPPEETPAVAGLSPRLKESPGTRG